MPDRQTKSANHSVDDDRTPLEVVAEEEKNGRGWMFYAMLGIGGAMGLCLVLFIVALGIGIAAGDSQVMADFVSVVRDMLIILMVLQGLVFGLGLILILYQVAVLLNLLQNEIDPIVEGAQETVDTTRGTAEFISRHLIEPIISGQRSFTRTREFFKTASGAQDLLSIYRNTKRDKKHDTNVMDDIVDNLDEAFED